MKRLAILKDSDVGQKPKRVTKWTKRIAARAVLFQGNKIALLHVSKQKYHKLPGGGLDANETILDGLRREVLEETGCTVQVKKPLGKIVEYRSHLKILQISHCFLAKVVRNGKSKLEPDEIADGFKLTWVLIEKALKLLQSDQSKTYDGKFIVKRDFIFLSKAKQVVE